MFLLLTMALRSVVLRFFVVDQSNPHEHQYARTVPPKMGLFFLTTCFFEIRLLGDRSDRLVKHLVLRGVRCASTWSKSLRKDLFVPLTVPITAPGPPKVRSLRTTEQKVGEGSWQSGSETSGKEVALRI